MIRPHLKPFPDLEATMAAPFDPSLVKFLKELTRNNNREWFTEHKARYERDVQQPALAFIEAMAPKLQKISPHVTADTRKVGGSLMRVYRDTRFAKDKRPYKTNVGIQFRHREGKDVHAPGFYLHIEPGSVFLGAGLWHPEREVLSALRTAILDKSRPWTAARNKVTAGAWSLAGESLKRAPAGVDPEHPLIEDLRRTDFIAVQELSPSALFAPRATDDIARAFAETKPLMKFLCGALSLSW